MGISSSLLRCNTYPAASRCTKYQHLYEGRSFQCRSVTLMFSGGGARGVKCWKICGYIFGYKRNYNHIPYPYTSSNIHRTWCSLPHINNCREDADDIVHRQLPPIPYGTYPNLRGVRQVVATNVGVCIPLSSIEIPAYVFRVCDVMSQQPPPLLKGVVNASLCWNVFCLQLIHTILLWLLYHHLTTIHLAISGPLPFCRINTTTGCITSFTLWTGWWTQRLIAWGSTIDQDLWRGCCLG